MRPAGPDWQRGERLPPQSARMLPDKEPGEGAYDQ